jgi:hypothetical protein
MTKAQELRTHKKTAAFHKRCMEAHAAEPGALNKTLASAHEELMIHHEACCKVIEDDSNSDGIDDADVTTESNRGGNGRNLDGPKNKAADAPFGMRQMMSSERDFTKIKPDGVHAVVPSRQFIPRTGGPGLPAPADSTTAIDSLKK